MRSHIQSWRNRRAFKAARRKANPQGAMVCGTVKNGKPIYFSAPREATDLEIQELAFRVREGREMADGERLLVAFIANRLRRTQSQGS